MSFTPKTTLEKILCGVQATAKTRLEKAVAAAISKTPVTVPFTLTENAETHDISGTTTAVFADVKAAYLAGCILQAEVTMPGGAIIYTTLLTTDNKANPTAFVFARIADLSGENEDPAPTYFSLVYASDGITVESFTMAVATSSGSGGG